MNSILDVKSIIHSDESIQRFEYHSLHPYTSTSANHDEIRICLQQQDVLSYPGRSKLYVEGKITVAPTKVLAAGEGLTDVAIHSLFSEIRYELNGIIIDKVRNPGMTSLMKGLASYTSSHPAYHGNSSWKINANGNQTDFNFSVPMKELLGFCEDYNRVMINAKQEIVLLRNRTINNSLYDKTGDKITSLTLTTVQWHIQYVQPDDRHRAQILNHINKKSVVKLPFRTWQLYDSPNFSRNKTASWPVRMTSASDRPRFAIIGFQTARNDNLMKINTHFDHCKIRSIRLHLGSEVFPYQALNAKFETKSVASLYDSFINFRNSYYYDDQAPNVSLVNFITKYPLWVIDCSHQNEVIKTGSVDVRLEVEADESIPADTTAYCLLLSDKMWEYNLFDGLVKEII